MIASPDGFGFSVGFEVPYIIVEIKNLPTSIVNFFVHPES
ncbi:hypothetical protein SAMN05192562_103404 [Kosakonia arachidis]|uniref:Uncharacterized protein n=1 Tax=Kosakonia arachidis TaxID=551989 RepID=A0A1I7CAX7_9ENTR|nr:hypothetical protein SAMN05192562_103404 [Kosakonia arachidis]